MSRGPVAVAALLLAAILAGCTATGPVSTASASPKPSQAAATPAPDPSIVPARELGTTPAMHVASGVTPPTNRWYSSLAFGDTYQPIFSIPLSWTPSATGFSFGLPRVTATANTIFGSAVSDITVTIADAAGGPTVVAADPVSVTAAWVNGSGDEGARVTLAEGWPVVGLTATQAVTLTVSSPMTHEAAGWWSTQVAGVTYGLVTSGGAEVSGDTIALKAGDTAQWFALPTGGDGTAFAQALGQPISGVSTTFDGTTTSLTYETAGDTVFVLPSDRDRAPGTACDLGTYESINGTLDVCRGSVTSWTSPAVEPAAQLDLGGISDDQKGAIVAALKADVADTPAFPGDSYFGAKALYRIANLLLLAKALDEDDIAKDLLSLLSEQLQLWAEPAGCVRRTSQCFVYDATMRGLVGVAPAFGSEDFNDHHFHYGYLLYAAGVAASLDAHLGATIAPVMDLVAADIASGATSADFPERRMFDPFSGHSWASGYSPFADGNNQESSSEAASAWNGLALWADARGEDALSASARWMLASEAASAVSLWVRPDLSAFPQFEHPVVGIQWSGKRDFATWFSPDQSAVLGIQLIPMPPTAAAYLAPADHTAATLVSSTVADATPNGFDVQFGDYLLMYLALAGPSEAQRAWDQALKLPAANIDDGDSRAYMLAWIAAAST